MDPHNITGSVVRPDIFSCIELTMAIIFASLSGLVGREAISNFVHRYIVPRATSYGEVYRVGDIRGQSGSGLRGIRVVEPRSWQKLDIDVKTTVVMNIEEVGENA